MLALLAALLLDATDPASQANVAKVAILQGAASANGTALKVGDPIDAGAVVKTDAGTRVAIDFADGCELRINENTELTVVAARKLDLKVGRIFIRIAKDPAKFFITTPHFPVDSLGAVLDIRFKERVPNGDPDATAIMCLEGKAFAQGPRFPLILFAGYWASGVGKQLNTPDPLKNGSLDTSWVHPLVLERGKADEETANRAIELVNILARETPDPVEPAMKALGDLVTAELVRFLQRSTVAPQAQRRAAATRIIAEAGTMKSAAALVGLLQHPEPEVRVIAAQGLARLAGGKDQGFNDAYWRGDKLEAGQKVWADWLQKNSK
jgi:hypothetical protein